MKLLQALSLTICCLSTVPVLAQTSTYFDALQCFADIKSHSSQLAQDMVGWQNKELVQAGKLLYIDLKTKDDAVEARYTADLTFPTKAKKAGEGDLVKGQLGELVAANNQFIQFYIKNAPKGGMGFDFSPTAALISAITSSGTDIANQILKLVAARRAQLVTEIEKYKLADWSTFANQAVKAGTLPADAPPKQTNSTPTTNPPKATGSVKSTNPHEAPQKGNAQGTKK